MEEPWQQRKCGSLLHSTTSSFSDSAPLEWRPQMLSNPNSILTSNKGPVNLTSTCVSAVQLSQYLNSHKFNGGASIYTLSSKPTVSFMCSSSSVPKDLLQAVGTNPQKSELGTQTMTSHLALREKLEDSYVPRAAQIALPVTNSVMEFNNITNTGRSANVCTAFRFSSDQLSSLSSSCPRVFCLGISGYLLLSNTGLLGIVCSCHGLHMSVSKFSEHSGLSHVNPGNAVRLDSGETITQWRKAFFQRLGARAPEDDSGWAWPEEFSATVGLEKPNAYFPYLSVKSDLPNRFGASGESWNNVSLSKDPYSYQNVVDKQLYTVKQRTSHSILNTLPDYNISSCLTVSNFDEKRGPDSASQAISAFIGSSSKSANTFMSVLDMQNLKARNVGGVDQEKVSSKFELRLGQPSQWSWTQGTSAQPTFGSNRANTCVVPLVPQKSQFPDQLLSESRDSRIIEESRQVLDGQQQGFNYSKNTSCVARNGDFDHGYLTPTDSRTMISSQAVPLRLALTDSSVIQTQSQMLSSKGGIDVKENTLDGNLRLFASQNMFGFSAQDFGIASPTPVQEQVKLRDPCEKLSNLASLASEELLFGLNFSNVQNTSSVATSSVFSCTSYPTGKSNETMASLTALPQGSFLGKNPEAQCHFPNHHSIDWSSLSNSSLGGVERKVLPIEQGKCCQRVLPKPVILGKCDCGVQTNTSASMKKNLLGSRLDKNYNFAEKITSFGENGMKTVESHFFQWKDVPRKVMGTCTSMSKDKSSEVLTRFGNIEGNQSADAGTDIPCCCCKSDEDPVSLKEPAISNISFGGLVPVTTQMSITIPNKELSTADADDAHCASNVVVDEGSGIDRCSDDSIGSEKSAELSDFASKINLLDKGSPEEFAKKSPLSLIDELRIRDSLLKKRKNQNHASFSVQENFNNIKKFEKSPNKVIGKRTLKWKKLNSTFPSPALSSTSHGCPECICGATFYSQSSKDKEAPFRCDQQSSNDCTCYIEPNFKRKLGMPSSEFLTWKRDCDTICFHETKNFDTETNQLKVDDDKSLGTLEESKRKRLKVETAAPTIKLMIHVSDTRAKPSNLGCSKISDLHQSFCKQMIKPIICGKYGIISNGNQSKPIKIVCLRNICDTMRKHCSIGKDKTKITLNGIKGRDRCFKESSNIKKVANCYPDKFAASKYYEDSHELSGGLDPFYLMEHTEKGYFNEGDAPASLPYSLRKRSYDCLGKNGHVTNSSQARNKQKCKEIRMRSIYELTIKDDLILSRKDSNYISFSEKSNSLLATDSKDVAEHKENAKDSGGNTSEIYDKNRPKDCQLQYQPRQDLDGVCCVCGSYNNDKSNCLLECDRCSIKVHQACYGICKVPKARWYCRPCRKNAKNIVCVLCGYNGGAMTQALQWHNIVKSLLQAWNVNVDFKPRSSSFAKLEELNTFAFTNYKPRGDTFPVNPLPQKDSSFVAVSDMCISKHINVGNSSSCHSMVDNSITAGVHDSTVKQWVHIVCGLWTPGTRCSNVDTMSAFDVSGASYYKDEVCSLCNRPGGCCIQCRVIYCFERFHPWCAHKKGLLQTEVEGFENESVGFYGTCMLHASYQQCDSISNLIDMETIHLVENDSICSRTEGYKGRKQEGVHYNPPSVDHNGGCLVPQEQLNAWLHINGQKSCGKGLPRFPTKYSEYDYRKEYAHYKQSKGWKGLVVYKSGIHALGLYTSHFISQGAMVVEYVGEVVGLRVADKRENEYLSGKKLQYKSACYFFRIDKEHIIDATCKGGIARFVNHSCLPNCIARVISVRNEKKVVFFAERDIYPGEEITYDYHFNHEDEGKKLPCYCNSKNCRRYLN